MNPGKKLSISDIAQELNTGKATIKFLVQRFKKYLPFNLIDGQPSYPESTVKQIFTIQGHLDMGLLPGDIEKKLDHAGVGSSNADEDIKMSNNGLTLLKSLFSDLGEQQKRIAKAHEKRAEVEERKAVAIEKRAEAEEKKADAMNNIAIALQEMNQLRTSDSTAQMITHQAVSIIAEDEAEDEIGDEFDDEIDDLSRLIDEEPLTEEPLTIDKSDQLDDLSLLIDSNIELDDLSKLIGDDPVQIDDLSKLIEDEPIPMDDLSKLIEDEKVPMDDLSKLIEDEKVPMDDLSKLIDEPDTIDETPEIKIDISPEDDLKKYKAAIMKIIIELKTDGLNIEETTNRLNKNKIKTLSGKTEWGRKAISQIYKFIDSAK